MSTSVGVNILDRITYRDHIKFRWQGEAGQHMRLVIDFHVVDSENPDKMIIVSHGFPCPWNEYFAYQLSEEEQLRWVFRMLTLAEIHEAREFFKVDGQVFDPPGHGLFNDPYS